MELDGGVASSPSAGATPVRSCTTCAKAKAKCVRHPTQDICDRCARLKKECFSKEPVLRKKKIVKTSRAAQLEKLESKIEHLVNALSNNTQVATSQHGHPSPAVSQSSRDKQHIPSAEVMEVICEDHIDSPQESGPPSPVTPVTSSAGNIFGGISPSEAGVLIDRYRRLMSPGMPFVIVPIKWTVRSMQESNPLLLHAILTVAYFHDLPKQQILVKELLREIADRILLKNEKSVDALQSILVFVAWYHIHIFWSQQVTNLLHLAMSVAIDMSMNRPPHQTLQDFRKATALPHAPSLGIRTLSLDEHRCLVGIFYISSLLAASFKKVHAMPYTKYMDDSLRKLEQAREYESDLLLVQLVRVQRVIEQIHTTDSPNAPVQMYVKAFQTDIGQLRKADPCRPQEDEEGSADDEGNVFLHMQYLIAEILMWELSLNDLQDRKTAGPSRPLISYLDDLYHCVTAIKSFIEIYFRIPPSTYVVLPFSVFAQFTKVFIILIKLSVLDIEGWDLKASLGQQGVTFSHVIDQTNARFDEASRTAPEGIAINNDTFSKFTHRLRWMKSVYEAKFGRPGDAANAAVGPNELTSIKAAAVAAAASMRGSGSGSASTNPTPEHHQNPLHTPAEENGGYSADFFNYVDENFWNSFVADFDLGFPDPGPMASGVA